MNRPLIGATTLGFGTRPIAAVFDGLVDVGAECCELNGRPGQHGDEVLTAEKVQPHIARTGVEVTSVGGYNNFAAEDLAAEVESLLGACRLASDLGIDLVRAMVADAAPGVTLDSIRPRVVDGFGRAADEAARLGVRLAIENHGRVANDGRWLAGVATDVGAENLGFTLDTGNFAWAGRDSETVADDIAAVLPRTISVHIKDVKWIDDVFEGFVPAGDGDIDLSGVLSTLADRTYRGPIVSEYEGPGDHAEGTRRSISQLKQLAESINWNPHLPEDS